jgi:hypothetical protein
VTVEAARNARSRKFTTVRKGYDPAEVDKRIAEYEEALEDLEEYAAKLKRELNQAQREIDRLVAAEKDSIDRAMLAVFDAKERIVARAMDRAREIEEAARLAAGLAPTDESESFKVVSDEQPVPTVAPSLDDGAVDPNTVMEKMLAEAEAIRNRLDSGLAAAFDQMEHMQRDAESRAAELIADARREAAQLRTASATRGPEVETAIAVNLSGEKPTEPDRPSRYSRNTARLPRLGAEAGPSIMATMNGLRTKMREREEAAG